MRQRASGVSNWRWNCHALKLEGWEEQEWGGRWGNEEFNFGKVSFEMLGIQRRYQIGVWK